MKKISCKFNSYKIKTYNLGVDYAHLKSWKLYAGNSEDNLKLIHFQDDTQALNRKNAVLIINLTKMFGPFNTFRVQTVSTHTLLKDTHYHVLRLGEFDIYGDSVGPFQCPTKRHSSINIFSFSFIINIFYI